MTAYTDGVTTGRSDEPTASPSDTAAIAPTAAEPTAAAVHTVYGSALPTVRPSEAVVRPVVPDDGPRPAIRADATGPAAVDGTMRAIVQDTYGSAGCCASRGSTARTSPTARYSCGCTRQAWTAARGI